MTEQDHGYQNMNLGAQQKAHDVIAEVLVALEEKGYNPLHQMVGYLLSGDPTYITNHNGARGVIRRIERDELLEVILQSYIERL